MDELQFIPWDYFGNFPPQKLHSYTEVKQNLNLPWIKYKLNTQGKNAIYPLGYYRELTVCKKLYVAINKKFWP